jgi:hypothetical protein
LIPSSLLALVAVGTLGCAPDRVGLQAYQLNQWTFQVAVEPEKTSVIVGEPIFLTLAVHNESNEDVQVVVGGDTLNRLRRPESFRIDAVRADGLRAATPESPSAGGSSARGPHRIPGRGSYRFSLFLPDWAEIREPGRYTITVSRTLEITRYGQDIPWTDPASVSRLDVRASSALSVAAADHSGVGEVIEARSRTIFGSHEEDARAAAKALGVIDDRRAIPHLVRAVAESPYSVRIIAVRALGRFDDDAALAAVTGAIHDSELGIRLSAASSLSRSPHPAAVRALIDLRDSPDTGVRHTVLQALAKQQSPESLELIREMTHDVDDEVRTEAHRYLRLRAVTTATPHVGK